MPLDKDKSEKERPFSPEERADLREMLESAKHLRWLKSILSGWASWLTVLITSMILGWDTVKKVLKAIVAGS